MTTASTDMEETEVREADGTATPQWLFDVLDAQVRALVGRGFELDAAASDWNAKCAAFFDEQTDALQQDWSRWPTIYCNAPFSATLLEQFARKALEAAEKGSTVVLVLPSWPGFEWFQELKRRGQVQDVVGPIHFEHHDGGKVTLNNGRKTSSIVVVTLGPRIVPGTNGGAIHNPSRKGWTTETPAGGTRPSRSKPVLCRLSELSPETTEWLWHLRIPKGELTVVDGDPSVNKSSLLLDIAARVSTGRAMPDGTAGGRGVSATGGCRPRAARRQATIARQARPWRSMCRATNRSHAIRLRRGPGQTTHRTSGNRPPSGRPSRMGMQPDVGAV